MNLWDKRGLCLCCLKRFQKSQQFISQCKVNIWLTRVQIQIECILPMCFWVRHYKNTAPYSVLMIVTEWYHTKNGFPKNGTFQRASVFSCARCIAVPCRSRCHIGSVKSNYQCHAHWEKRSILQWKLALVSLAIGSLWQGNLSSRIRRLLHDYWLHSSCVCLSIYHTTILPLDHSYYFWSLQLKEKELPNEHCAIQCTVSELVE